MSTPNDRTRLPPAAIKSDSGWLNSSDAISHGRFAPGTILADRYRILGLLGQGGMGEVYRADDLKLGQQVALKFLPGDFARDVTRLARFHSEVRLSRQISHPNVCRVYDVGEVDGDTFLSMEYVDGEDLSSLLRRIGRLPEDKATEMARQLCAGVAAAHARGVLHRDLKPANVMIDGRGSVRVMDFGLAVATGTTEIDRAGTPAYMAPEQLAGGKVTAQSDIYALGLVLYEMFTGRRAHNPENLADLIRMHESDTTTRPTEIVQGLDPAIERAIMRCLEREPARRPASALAVSAALPGGDPLAAALAAGETPSPAMVAAAGREDALGLRTTYAALAVIVGGLAVLPFIFDRVLLVHHIAPPKPIDVLIDRADTIRKHLGYQDARDQVHGIDLDDDYLRYIADTDRSPARWERLRSDRSPALQFWYRSSPRLIINQALLRAPTESDPPLTVSGMTLMSTDLQGRLLEFHAVPPQREAEPDAQSSPGTAVSFVPNWRALFAAADLDIAAFTPAASVWTPRSYADARAAWVGILPGESTPVRIEAASYRGDPVYFQIVGPWTRPARMTVADESTRDVVLSFLGTVLLTAILCGIAVGARRQVRRGRADRPSANRLAAFVMTVLMVSWLLGTHHVPDAREEINTLFLFFGLVLLISAVTWMSYVALEPVVRKWNPRALVGWTRLVAGNFHDPQVGRDLLAGTTAGVMFALIRAPRGLMRTLVGAPPGQPLETSFGPLDGIGMTLSDFAAFLHNPVNNGLMLVLVFAVTRMLLRGTTRAVVTCALIAIVLVAIDLFSRPGAWTELLLVAAVLAVVFTVVVRYGLLATIVMFFVSGLPEVFPLTADPSTRYFAMSLCVIAGVLALAVFAAHAARAGQPLFTVSKFD